MNLSDPHYAALKLVNSVLVDCNPEKIDDTLKQFNAESSQRDILMAGARLGAELVLVMAKGGKLKFVNGVE